MRSKKYQNEYSKKRREKLKEKGICVCCCTRKTIDGKVVCERCLQLRREKYNKERKILKNAGY